MKNAQYFKPTPLYKEYMILDLIEKNRNITQRELSENINASVSMINSYLDIYEKSGLIIRRYISDKKIEYIITKKGIERKKVLNIGFLKASHKIYSNAKENIKQFLNQLIYKGYKDILLYGAGEVAELLLLVLNDDDTFDIKIKGIIDDDKEKQGKFLFNIPILNNEKIDEIKHDGILISSFMNRETIYDKLNLLKYNKKNIIMFFEI